MKQNLFAFIGSTLLTIGTFTAVNAQQSQNGDIAKLEYTVKNSATDLKNTAALSSKAGSKAFKNFSKQFKAIENADWFVTDDAGFVAQFAVAENPTRAFYNDKGQFEYSITRYTAAKAPANIINNVKRTFDGYRVICAEEIMVEGKTIYLVHIQSFTSSKTVRVANDEMEVIEELFHN